MRAGLVGWFGRPGFGWLMNRLCWLAWNASGLLWRGSAASDRGVSSSCRVVDRYWTPTRGGQILASRVLVLADNHGDGRASLIGFGYRAVVKVVMVLNPHDNRHASSVGRAELS